MSSKIRTVFMGTSDFAVPALEALVKSGFIDLIAVVTQPDKPAGRNLELQPPPIKVAALKNNLQILQPLKAREPGFIEKLAQYKPELIVVAAYGQILPQAILDIPPFGCLNVHASLLPEYRGAAPIQWALINGDTETGVTIMKIDAGLDSGAILTQRRVQILDTDNAQTLHDRLARVGSELLVETIPPYIEGKIIPQPQDHSKATYTKKITKEDGHIDWKLSAREIVNRIRAFTPWPGAYSFLQKDDKRLMIKILEAEPIDLNCDTPGKVISVAKNHFIVCCGKGALKINQVQPEGRKKMSSAEYLAGNKLEPGQIFT